MSDTINKTNKKSLLAKFRNYLLTGLVIVGPLILTILIIMWVVNLIDSIVGMVLNLFPQSYIPKGAFAPGIGVIIAIIFLVLVGIIGKNYLGKYIINWTGNIIRKVPIVKFIYGTIKQIFDTVFSSQGKAFKFAVLVEFPTKDSWTIGFVTSDVKDNVFSSSFNKKYQEEELISVFVPATPNPTSGFLLYVLKKNIIVLDISPNVAMKIILSGGMLSPEEVNKENESNTHKITTNK